jgi:hypothetical protein
VPKGKEEEARFSKTPTRDNVAPKNLTQKGNPIQKPMQQKKGSAPKKYGQSGKKDTSLSQEEKGRGGTTT